MINNLLIFFIIKMLSDNDKIITSFNNFFDENEKYTRKELLEFANKIYDENFNKIKKPLNAYQLFMKEQRAILNIRENEKIDGIKKKSTELLKEIAEMWKQRKNLIEEPLKVKKPTILPKLNDNDEIKILPNKWRKL